MQSHTNSLNDTAINYWAPEARIAGVRMLKKDADRIRAEVTDVFGLPTQSDNIYVVFDVL